MVKKGRVNSMLSELCTISVVEVKLNDNEDRCPTYGGFKVKLVSDKPLIDVEERRPLPTATAPRELLSSAMSKAVPPSPNVSVVKSFTGAEDDDHVAPRLSLPSGA